VPKVLVKRVFGEKFNKRYPQLRPALHRFWPAEQVAGGFFDQLPVGAGIGCCAPSPPRSGATSIARGA